jgi:hypothetical protein
MPAARKVVAALISDRPMTEEEWARERATVIDAEPDEKPKK